MNTENVNIFFVCYLVMFTRMKVELNALHSALRKNVGHNRLFRCQITIASKVRKKNFTQQRDSKISLTVTVQSIVEYNYGDVGF